MDVDFEAADLFQVLRYDASGDGPLEGGRGEWYKPHVDYFQAHDGYIEQDLIQKNGTNRFATLFMYLSDVEEGGHTVFPLSTSHAGYTGERLVRNGTSDTPGSIDVDDALYCCNTTSSALRSMPKKGNAVLFYSQTPLGALDPFSLHGGCPVVKGVKWAGNIWIWNRRRPQ